MPTIRRAALLSKVEPPSKYSQSSQTANSSGTRSHHPPSALTELDHASVQSRQLCAAPINSGNVGTFGTKVRTRLTPNLQSIHIYDVRRSQLKSRIADCYKSTVGVADSAVMRPYDFRCVPTGVLLPLMENDFLFAVAGAPIAVVTKDGISCALESFLQLTHPVDIFEMDVALNLIDPSKKAMITALCYDEAALKVGAVEVVKADPGVAQTIKFHVHKVIRFNLRSLEGQFFLQAIRWYCVEK
jgi:hypothetical protein